MACEIIITLNIKRLTISRKMSKQNLKMICRSLNYLIMKILKLNKDVVEQLSSTGSKQMKGGTVGRTAPAFGCVTAYQDTCWGYTCEYNTCVNTCGTSVYEHTCLPPCKDISVVDPNHTLNNCFVTRQTCAC